MPFPEPDQPPPPPPLSYRSGPEARGDYVTPEHRSARNWVILSIVWVAGLAVWGLYVAMLVVLVYRWFGGQQ